MKFRNSMAESITKMDPGKVTVSNVENFHGADLVVHMQVKMPWPMTNRSLMNAYYWDESQVANGVYIQCGSSRGNEKVLEDNAKAVGKDVIGSTHIAYIKIEETEGGAKWTQVQCVDMGGSIPDMMKGKIAARQAKQGFNTINFILTGSKIKD